MRDSVITGIILFYYIIRAWVDTYSNENGCKKEKEFSKLKANQSAEVQIEPNVIIFLCTEYFP